MKNDFKFARDALRYIIKNNGVQEIYIPYYLCDVIRHAVFAEGAKPLFYHIDDNFMPVRDFPLESFILYPNYFGICDGNVDKLVKTFASIYSPHKVTGNHEIKRKIFDKYHNIYADTNQLSFDISEEAIPFCYPYLASTIEEADKLVEKLTARGLTIYRYWNQLPASYNEYKFYSRLVPIPLD